ncbi:MAG: nuclease [Pirellulaceae bacterium]|nr:nuclease [Pirellulaceae bacterium]
MTSPVMLDSSVLGQIAHPRIKPDIKAWLESLRRHGIPVIHAEVSDYEVRRELVRTKNSASIARLDFMKLRLVYQPLTTNTMLRASQLWADARNRGKPTAANNRLDADAILAAQAMESSATLISDNVSHLIQFVPTFRWRDFVLPTP